VQVLAAVEAEGEARGVAARGAAEASVAGEAEVGDRWRGPLCSDLVWLAFPLFAEAGAKGFAELVGLVSQASTWLRLSETRNPVSERPVHVKRVGDFRPLA
jgi:hypothetical protein